MFHTTSINFSKIKPKLKISLTLIGRALVINVIFYGVLIVANIASAKPVDMQPAMQHGKAYQGDVQLSEYLVSEKLDGVRARFDGRQLLSRNGVVFKAPDWFLQGWPEQALDGELWIDRNQFSKTLSVVSKEQPHDGWQSVRFMVFDMPGSIKPFVERVVDMNYIVDASNSRYLAVIEQQKIDSVAALQTLLDQVIVKGGEGLMLHKKQALYKPGRNANVLKVKRFADDEAVVVAHHAGKGKFANMMGSITVRNRQGQEFKIGTGFNRQERVNPPAIGSTITYRYWGKTVTGLPRFASYWRPRALINLAPQP
ncbi:DNA ligase [Thalassotalea sp. Y01]|uniref:DNA ligase n=1 Tax=Thalassotalea sp. Y01 TaxID=2729613 RepID=UPI00145F9B1B|nr:DNA ligase [Thalassotalea sp. Y01]NMP15197.1 DNA ligase [Thalassotalea sp. Y01]